jgi:hypothetical protein
MGKQILMFILTAAIVLAATLLGISGLCLFVEFCITGQVAELIFAIIVVGWSNVVLYQADSLLI